MRDNAEWQQMCEERQMMTEEAFKRAQDGTATKSDWQFLAAELGLNIFKKEKDYVSI